MRESGLVVVLARCVCARCRGRTHACATIRSKRGATRPNHFLRMGIAPWSLPSSQHAARWVTEQASRANDGRNCGDRPDGRYQTASCRWPDTATLRLTFGGRYCVACVAGRPAARHPACATRGTLLTGEAVLAASPLRRGHAHHASLLGEFAPGFAVAAGGGAAAACSASADADFGRTPENGRARESKASPTAAECGVTEGDPGGSRRSVTTDAADSRCSCCRMRQRTLSRLPAGWPLPRWPAGTETSPPAPPEGALRAVEAGAAPRAGLRLAR